MRYKSYNLIILLSFTIYCQAQEYVSLDDIFETYKQGKTVYKQIRVAIDENDSQYILDVSYKYILSENEKDRQLACRFLYELVNNDNKDTNSKNAVYYLVDKGLTDKSSILMSIVLGYLEEFSKELFDERTKNRLASIILENPNQYKRIVMLSGKLEMEQLVSYYENRLAGDSTLNRQDVWGLQLTLARFGDPMMVSKCIEQVNTIGMNDQVIYNLIPDLLYIENKLVTDYLLDEISIENMNCTSADPDNEVVIDCAYRLVEYLAPYVQDFPVSVGASGDLDCDNYEQALMDVRAWISGNRDNYKTIFEE